MNAWFEKHHRLGNHGRFYVTPASQIECLLQARLDEFKRSALQNVTDVELFVNVDTFEGPFESLQIEC
jgi:hypothetical protein